MGVQTGDKIPIEQFFVSKMNIRAEENFGKSEEDQCLSQNLVKGSLVQPMRARPEKNDQGVDGFGVYVGRRRLLSLKRARKKTLTVGEDVLISELSDAEALDDSIRENLETFRSQLNPVTRAKALKRLMETKGISLRDLANVWRIPPANVSDWMAVLKLGEDLQKSVAEGKIMFTDALKLVRMNLPAEQQKELAECSGKSYDEFKAQFERIQAGREKRGIPEGKYEILRVPFEKGNREELETYQKFVKLAEVIGRNPQDLLKELISTFLARGGKL